MKIMYSSWQLPCVPHYVILVGVNGGGGGGRREGEREKMILNHNIYDPQASWDIYCRTGHSAHLDRR